MNGAFGLTSLAIGVVIVISAVSWLTKAPIERGQKAFLATSINEILPSDVDSVAVVENRFEFKNPALGTEDPQWIYPVVKQGDWQGAAITAIAPDGYTGDIQLLIGIREDSSLFGVRVLAHKETPGLGDDIEFSRSNWITAFDDASLQRLSKELWTVKKDGGAFDQFTGATITPRAVVHAVYRVINWHEQGGNHALQAEYQRQRSIGSE